MIEELDANARARLLRFGVGLVVLLTLVGVAANAAEFSTAGLRTPGPRDILPIESVLGSGSTTDEPTVADPIELPEPVVIGLAVALGIALLYVLSRQRLIWRFRRPSFRFARASSAEVTNDETDAEVVAEFARDLIDELNEGDSPRHAIQRAYAAVETGFGAPELTRRPAETPLRYLDRIFGRHKAVSRPLEELTELFQHARFSSEPVDEDMRAAAIAALGEIRDHYSAIAWNRIANSRSKAAA